MVHPNFCKDTDFSWLEQKLAEENSLKTFTKKINNSR
jgi:hypothetical protein